MFLYSNLQKSAKSWFFRCGPLSFRLLSSFPTIFTLRLFILLLSAPNAYSQAFNPRQIPVEIEAWWNHAFGHIHATTAFPVGQVVSGNLDLNVRIVMHNNPSHLFILRFDEDDTGIVKKIPLSLDCPFDGVT